MNENRLSSGLKRWKESPMAKLIIILVIALFILIPLSAVKDLMRERENRMENAKFEVVSQWGGLQHIAGPILAVPVEEEYTEGYGDKKETKILIHYLYILPDSLDINGEISSHMREKGIFEIELYSGEFNMKGSFSKPNDPLWKMEKGEILWEETRMILGLGDVKGLSKAVELNWEESEPHFQGGTSGAPLFKSGISAPVEFKSIDNATFDLSVSLKGGSSLEFFPLGEETRVSINSDWVSPGFSGAFIPTERELDDKGFHAVWEIQALARNYPQHWIDDEATWTDIKESYFGVNFLTPIDSYFKSHRAIKYGLLFVFLPFITLFLLEIFNKKNQKLHPFQYIMVGLSVTMFFLLLLTFSEHMGFHIAYLISAFASSLLVSFYTGALFKKVAKGFLMAILNASLYLYLYMALSSEDFALLIGSIGLFTILSGIMIITRKINWYDIGKK